MHRYLVLVRDSAYRAGTEPGPEAGLLHRDSWEIAYNDVDLLVAHRPPSQRSPSLHTLDNRQGVIVGSLFRRRAGYQSVAQPEAMDASEGRRILDTEGRHLVENYWGSYVAILRDPRSRHWTVMRDPTANLACFLAKHNNTYIFFSDVGDFLRYMGHQPTVNWSYVAARLLAGCLLSRTCGLLDVEDIPGGERVVLAQDSKRRLPLWTPSSFCTQDGFEDVSSAAQELRTTVLNAVQALASEHSEIMIRLSGGLDSSIVTTCLSQQKGGPRVTCLNFYVQSDQMENPQFVAPPGYTKDDLAKLRRVIGSADEREFARSVATRCRFALYEREKRIWEMDLPKIWKAPLACRPSNYVFSIDEDDAEIECAMEQRATACFTGQAGDTVFYNSQRILAALDYAYLNPIGPHIFHHVRRAAILSGESIPRVFGKVVKYGMLRLSPPPGFNPMKRPHLLSDAAATSVPDDYFCHPWLETASTLCPGKYGHVLGMAQSGLFYPDVYHRENIAPSVHPLASQPVVELCLRIPTYILLTDATSRGLARRAFNDFLPREVVRRTVKGAPIGFWQRVLRHNVKFLREVLLDGTLVRKGLLDRHKLEAYLIQDQPFLTVQPYQIMDYLACEAWLHQLACT